MEKTIFRREESKQEEARFGTMKKVYEHRRRDMKPFVSCFNDNEKNKLIRTLFNRNPGLFDTFMNELNVKGTWPEAYMFMEAELKTRKIDIMSHDARRLTDRIYQQFFPEEI